MSDQHRTTLYLAILGVIAVVAGTLIVGDGELLSGLLPWR